MCTTPTGWRKVAANAYGERNDAPSLKRKPQTKRLSADKTMFSDAN